MAQRNNEWHLRDPEAVASVLDTDIYRGLEHGEVRKRRRREGKNNIWHVRRTSATEYALKSLGDMTGLVLIIAALTAAVFERSIIALTVCVILALGVVFRVLTYVKSKRILETLADEGIPSATVIRGGETYIVRADGIVQGDVVVLGPGDIVPCDGRIVYGDEIRVSEQGITENKTSVIKGDTVILTDAVGAEIPCEYRVNMLFAGSAILSGSCRIVATACGDDALVSMRRGGLLIPSGDDVPVINELSEWCRRGSVAVLLCVFVLSGLAIAFNLLRGGTFSIADAFIDAMALAAASVSSYLINIGYMSLTVPVRRVAEMKDGRAVVKDITNIHKIADVSSVIVSDISVFKSGKASYTSYFADGKLHEVKKADVKAGAFLADILKTIPKSDVSTSLSGDSNAKGKIELLLDKVTLSSKEEHGIDLAKYASHEEIPVDYKAVKATHNDTYNVIVRKGANYEIHLCGDIADVLPFCDRYTVNGREKPMSEDDRRRILKQAEVIRLRGGEIIAKAHRMSIYTTLKRLSVLQSNMCFDGFITVEQGIDPKMSDVSREFERSGMSVVLLSSDSVSDRGYLANMGVITESCPIITCRDVIEGKTLPSGSFIVAVPPKGENGGKIDAAGKIRIASAIRLTEKIPNSLVITSEPSESGMMAGRTVGAAVSTSDRRPIPQTLKRRAEISVYPKTEPGYGGFYETLRTVSASVCALENLRRAALYTIMAQMSRFVCMLLSIITDTVVMNAANILLLGMIFDFGAVVVLAFTPERLRVPDGDKKRRRIPSIRDIVSYSWIGIAAGAVAFASSMLPVTGLIPGIPSHGTVSALTISLLLMQFVILSELILDGGSLKHGRDANVAYFLYAVVLLVTVLMFMFSGGVTSMFGDVKPNWLLCTISASGALLLLIGYEIVKLIIKRK